MATPGELVQCVARLLALPTESVTQIDRLLAENGMRRTGGRGKSAAKMTEADAAALLIAASIPGSLKTVPERTRAFMELPFKDSQAREIDQEMPFPSVAGLPEHHTFGDALTALFQAATRNEFHAYLASEAAANPDRGFRNFWQLEVSFYMPGKAAVIQFMDQNVSVRQNYNSIPQDRDGLAEWSKRLESDPSHGDLSTVCKFTSRTILAVAKLISGEAEA